ncbi:MAG: SpoIIIAH-like family protein [Eubacteriales bacterium]
MTTGKKNDFTMIWKRNAVAGAITLFVCAAVYLNWSYDQEVESGKTLGEAAMVAGETSDPLLEETTLNVVEEENNYFATARLNRQQARDSALTLLQDAAVSSEDPTLLDQTNAAIATMANFTVTEAQIENLVMAKGYLDCVAFIGDESISIAVSLVEGGMTDADTARIVDVVNQSTGFEASQIKIIEVE